MQSINVHARRRSTVQPRRLKRLLLMPVASLFFSGCAAPIRTAPVSESLQQTLQALAKQHHVCGVVLAVIKNRKLASHHVASGCMPAPALSPDSVFQAASLSKPVFAYAVLKLVAQGKMALDAPVLSYLPQGYRHQVNPIQATPVNLVSDPRIQAITVRMVLNHTSGLPNWASGPLHVKSPPGTTWAYSGEGYVLLQRAVEAVSGQPLDQLMAAQVFEPLAMTRSSFVWKGDVAPSLLPGTKANGVARTNVDFKTPNAAFSLYTSAQDYAKLLVTVLNDGDVIKQITASPVTVDQHLGLSWGLGWGIERVQEETYIWQWGNNMGYRAFSIASVGTGDGFVMLTNSDNGLKLAQPLTEKITSDKHPIFKSSILGTDVLLSLCTTVGLCL